MIKNLYRLGKAIRSEEKYEDYFSPWQHPFPKVDMEKAKVIYFDIEDGEIKNRYSIEPFKPAMLKHYLYRKPKGARGAQLVPTDYFYPSGKEKDHAENIRKLMSRLDRAFSNGEDLYFPSKSRKKEALNYIEQELLSFEGSPEDRYLLTFKVDGRWLGEFPQNIELFEAEAYSKYYEKSNTKDYVCAITYEESPEVWGRVDTLGFTVNDLTFSRSGFNPKESYKMFSASPESVKTLEGARRFALSKLTRSFYSLNYFIIPHFIQEDDEAMLEAVGGLVRASQENSGIGDYSRSILNNERVIADIAEEKELAQQGIFYDILFFQKKQAQFAIKLHLTDILPSRFSQIFHAKKKIEKRYGRINRIKTKKETLEFFVTFSRIQRYFSTKANNEVIFHPFFFQILESVFYSRPLDEVTVLSAFIEEIRRSFKQRHEDRNGYLFRTKEAFALWHFFLELNLFNDQNKQIMEDNPVPRTLDAFVEAHPEFFADPYKKAAFYMGCLTELLLQAQRRKLGSEPFLERLSGLNLDDRDLKTLFPRLQEKMNQYGDVLYKYVIGREYIQKLRAEIVPVLMEPSESNRVDISFAFSAGLVMQKEFTQQEIDAHREAKAKAGAE